MMDSNPAKRLSAAQVLEICNNHQSTHREVGSASTEERFKHLLMSLGVSVGTNVVEQVEHLLRESVKGEEASLSKSY